MGWAAGPQGKCFRQELPPNTCMVGLRRMLPHPITDGGKSSVFLFGEEGSGWLPLTARWRPEAMDVPTAMQLLRRSDLEQTQGQLSGLKKVGAQTTFVGGKSLKLRNHQAPPAQGHLGLCMSPPAAHSSLLNQGTESVKVDWLVWFPLNNTPPNKLRHPVLVCSQDTLLAFDPTWPFSFYHS